jgi:hypoxanthine phosphoribosyltransferase
MNKVFITASELLQDSFRLAARIHDSGFEPDFIVGIWRGGTPVGVAIQEYFEYVGVRPDHIAVRTSAYVGIGQRTKTIRVHGLHYIIDEANAGNSLLIVDDVFDSGHSIEALLEELASKMRLNMPREIRIATPWYKPGNNRTKLLPDYYLHQTDAWLVFPHELAGLSIEEIRTGKKELASVLELLQRRATRGGGPSS